MYIDTLIVHNRAELLQRTPIVSGSKGFYKIRCLFSEDWDGLSKYIVFPSAECSMAIDGGSAELPEALIEKSGCLSFGFIGLDSSGEKRITTNLLAMSITKGTNEADSPPPSPDESATWESYIGKIAQSYLSEMRRISENVQEQVQGFTVYSKTDDSFDFDNPPAVFAAYVRNTAKGNSYAYYYSVLSLLNKDRNSGVQIRLRCSSHDLQIRHKSGGKWSDWKAVSSWKNVDA